MNEFKLNYYFQMYKDKVFNNSREFKDFFIKKHGEFQYLSELVVRIYNYQSKKYGGRLTNCFLVDSKEERKRKKTNSYQRHRQKIRK